MNKEQNNDFKNIRRFILISLAEDKKLMKKDIRKIKKSLSSVDDMLDTVREMSHKQIEELLEKEPIIMENYNKLLEDISSNGEGEDNGTK